MRTLGNILWHVPFFGFINALLTFLLGSLLVLTVVGAPIGLGLVQLSKFYLSPFSKSMISKSDLNAKQNALWKSFGIIIQIIYFPLGLILTAFAILQIVASFCSLIGIPVAIVIAKSLSTILMPVNKTCVSKAVADEVASRKARAEVNKTFGE